jgi:hypothetical protein
MSAAAAPGGPLGTQSIIKVSTKPANPNRKFLETQNSDGSGGYYYLYYDTPSDIHTGDSITGPFYYDTTQTDTDNGITYYAIIGLVAIVCPHP